MNTHTLQLPYNFWAQKCLIPSPASLLTFLAVSAQTGFCI